MLFHPQILINVRIIPVGLVVFAKIMVSIVRARKVSKEQNVLKVGRLK